MKALYQSAWVPWIRGRNGHSDAPAVEEHGDQSRRDGCRISPAATKGTRKCQRMIVPSSHVKATKAVGPANRAG